MNIRDKELLSLIAKANKEIEKLGWYAAKYAKDDLEKNLEKAVITSENNLNYKYIDAEE